MNHKKNKDLAKIALAAFMLSAAMPVAAHANIDAQSQGTLLASGGCGAASSQHPAHSTCGAAPTRRSPATSGCGAAPSASNNSAMTQPSETGATGNATPAGHSCGAAQSSSKHTPASQGCGAATQDDELASSKKTDRKHRPHQTTPQSAQPAATQPTPSSAMQPGTLAMRDNVPAEGMRAGDSMGYMNDSNDSSYQGTTTGPGPNGGYPGAPHGSYNSKR